MESFFNTPQENFEEADVAANKTVSYCAYLMILFVIPLLAAPDSPFAKYHANQGLVLFIFAMLLSAFTTVAGFIFGLIPLFGGILTALLGFVAAAAVIGLAIVGIINVSNGLGKELPVIGRIKLIK